MKAIHINQIVNILLKTLLTEERNIFYTYYQENDFMHIYGLYFEVEYINKILSKTVYQYIICEW